MLADGSLPTYIAAIPAIHRHGGLAGAVFLLRREVTEDIHLLITVSRTTP